MPKEYSLNIPFSSKINNEQMIRRYPILNEDGSINYELYNAADQFHIMLSYYKLRKSQYREDYYDYIFKKEILGQFYENSHVLSQLKLLLQTELNMYFAAKNEKDDGKDVNGMYCNDIVKDYIAILKELQNEARIFEFFGATTSVLSENIPALKRLEKMFSFSYSENERLFNVLSKNKDDYRGTFYTRVILIFISAYAILACNQKNKLIKPQYTEALEYIGDNIDRNREKTDDDLIVFIARQLDEAIETEQVFYQEMMISISSKKRVYNISAKTRKIYLAIEDMIKQINAEAAKGRKINCLAILRFEKTKHVELKKTFIAISGVDINGETKVLNLEHIVEKELQRMAKSMNEDFELIKAHDDIRYYLKSIAEYEIDEKDESIIKGEIYGMAHQTQSYMQRINQSKSAMKLRMNYLKRMFSCCERKLVYRKDIAKYLILNKAELLIMFKPCLICNRMMERRKTYAIPLEYEPFDKEKKGSFTESDLKKTDTLARKCHRNNQISAKQRAEKSSAFKAKCRLIGRI